MRTWLIAGVATLSLVMGGATTLKTRSPATAPSEPRINPLAGKVLVITLQSDPETSTTLENPVLRHLGGHDFLIGRCITAEDEDDWREGQTVWTAVDDISQIVEYANREELNQRDQVEREPEATRGV